MKFAHIADVHLGGWKEPKMQEVADKAFCKAIAICISEKVDFVLIAGDLFNTSMPNIEALKLAVVELRRLKKSRIPVYVIAGSHDFSPSGKTMLDVLEEADLFVNVCKGEVIDEMLWLRFTVDEKTGAKITGMLGKKGQLDKKYYEKLDLSGLEDEDGFKIFMFHTAITELKTKELAKMESSAISLLPKRFNYYAGGHVHIVRKMDLEGYPNVVYPGPTYPNSFSELEKLKGGSMYIYDSGEMQKIDLGPIGTVVVDIDAEHKTPESVVGELTDSLSHDVTGKLVLVRVGGVLESGKVSDIGFKRLFELANENGAYFVMKNTNKLRSKDYEEVKVAAKTNEEAEKLVVEENVGQVSVLDLDKQGEKELVENLMQAFDSEKHEGEKNADYEQRILSEANKIFN